MGIVHLSEPQENYQLRTRTKNAIIVHLVQYHDLILPVGVRFWDDKAHLLISFNKLELILMEKTKVRNLGKIGIIDIENMLISSQRTKD